jgi:threonine dehydratase
MTLAAHQAAPAGPKPADVVEAADRIAGAVHRTPLQRSRAIADVAGCSMLLLKGEHLQRTGSYKARGAINFLRRVRESEPDARGVVAASSGNHGQAVAWAAREVGLAATVVVPGSITALKRRAIEGYGAVVDVVGDDSDERLGRARRLAAQSGLVEVPPYDHPWTIAGQGTWLLEALEQAPSTPEVIVVPVSGGGLAAGTVLAARAAGFTGRIVGVEPAGADDTRRSIAAGHRVRLERPSSVADALRAAQPGELTFSINRDGLAEVVIVTDADIVTAMVLLLERAKQLVEPGGATALAALVADRIAGADKALVILSGGNVAAERLPELLRESEV